VPHLRRSDSYEDEPVLCGLQAVGEGTASKSQAPGAGQALPDMQRGVPCDMARQEGRQVPGLLQQTLRGDRALTINGGPAQSEMEERRDPSQTTAALGEGIPNDEAFRAGEGPARLRSMRRGRAPECAPHRQLADEQRGIEPGDALFEVSSPRSLSAGIEAADDPVAMVERLHEPAAVYDIQVGGPHNFFANGILVHNCGIIDDPTKDAEEAQSANIREKIWEWYRTVFRTRAAPGAAIVVVMTRWHCDDLVGRLLRLAESDPQADQWEVLHLPAISDGQALWPERYPIDVLEGIRTTIGSQAFAALYQGLPEIEGGNIVRREWWKYYRELPKHSRIIHSWDTAFKGGQSDDWSVCTVWAEAEAGYYLVDLWRGRVEFPELKRQAVALNDRDHPTAILVEDAASGQSLIQELRRGTRLPVLPVRPDRDKISRMTAVTPLIEAGRVLLPERAPWLADYLGELSAFPNGEHDDQADSTSQALGWLALQRAPSLFIGRAG